MDREGIVRLHISRIYGAILGVLSELTLATGLLLTPRLSVAGKNSGFYLEILSFFLLN
jgi:hypothetical protein